MHVIQLALPLGSDFQVFLLFKKKLALYSITSYSKVVFLKHISGVRLQEQEHLS